MISAAVRFISFVAAASSAAAYSGVDVSQRTYTSAWQCLAGDGNTFAIVRVYQSNGQPDPNGEKIVELITLLIVLIDFW